MDRSSSGVIAINGARLDYTLAGRGKNLVFLHGWMCNQTFWQAQCKELVRRNFRCLTLDFRGHGNSQAPTSGYSMEQLTNDVGEIVRDLGLDRAVIIGHSMGGMVAQQFCLERPEQTAGLVLVATIACDPENRLISKRIQADACRMGFPLAFDRHFNAWFSPNTPASIRNWVETQMLSTPEDVSMELVSAYGCFDLTRRLKEIRRPTLVIGTQSDDSAPPGQSRRLAELIPGAELALIEDCGHFPMLEKPEALNQELRSFLEDRADSGKD